MKMLKLFNVIVHFYSSASNSLIFSTDSGGGASIGATGLVLCSWCGRVCGGGGQRGSSAFQLSTTSGELHFCSEVCFTQCRRASFKKSKVCDWCRHVRPTVTYVDFTDGDHQLQFCRWEEYIHRILYERNMLSARRGSQIKVMDITWKETNEHCRLKKKKTMFIL